MKPVVKILPQIVIAVLFSLPLAAWSQPAPQREVPVQRDQETLERWQRMSPEEKQELRERYQRWKSLPPEQKADLQKRFENWQHLSPDEKATVRKNYERWQRLSTENSGSDCSSAGSSGGRYHRSNVKP